MTRWPETPRRPHRKKPVPTRSTIVPDPWPHSITTATYRRTRHLFVEQKGLCWICARPMLLPRTTFHPGRITATIDHLCKKNPSNRHTRRPAKAAHLWCNNTRHHNDPDPKYVAQMHKLFDDPTWRHGAYDSQLSDFEKSLLSGTPAKAQAKTLGPPCHQGGEALLTGACGGALSEPNVRDTSSSPAIIAAGPHQG